MQNDFETFKRMLTSKANMPDPSKNPMSRNDGRNFFHQYFYNNVASKFSDGEYKKPIYLNDKSYDFYHLLIEEREFRKLLKKMHKSTLMNLGSMLFNKLIEFYYI